MTTPLALFARQARLLALRELMNTAGAGIQFYTGIAEPATPETATAETLLGTVLFATPSGAIGASGSTATLTITVPRTASAIATGIVGWARFVTDTGVAVLDRPCVAVGGTGPIILSDLQVYAGGELQLISCVISE